jgi:hypothetical protein
LLIGGQRRFAVLDHQQAPAARTVGIKNPPERADVCSVAGF